MPAWGDGTAETAQGSWHLVHFIRKPPALTQEDVAQMEALNPRSPSDAQEDEETRKFLEGDDETPQPPTKPTPAHGGNK